MPVRNEAGHIRRSLDAVLAQDYPADCLEIIVADGLSTDGTRAMLDAYQAQHGNFKVIDNPGQIVPTGLNAALRQAQGEIIVRVDGHCLIAPDYVRRCVDHLVRDVVEGVGGPIETIGATSLARTIAAAMSTPFGVGDSAFRTRRTDNPLVDTIPFPAYTRAIIRRAGLYDEELIRNQDDEYNYRLRELGARLMLASDVRSEYYSRATVKALWRQYFQYGFWKVRVLQKHPRQMRRRQFVPPLFVAGLLGLSLLTLAAPGASAGLAVVAGAYALANIGASIWTAARQGWPHLGRLPVVYAILHVSYGLGFLAGLIKFANRWRDKTGRVPAFEESHA